MEPKLGSKTKDFIEAHSRGSEYILKERRAALKRLTFQESLIVYSDLFMVWSKTRRKEDEQVLERRKIDHLVEFRAQLNKIDKRFI